LVLGLKRIFQCEFSKAEGRIHLMDFGFALGI
jgi:hypothetical protein